MRFINELEEEIGWCKWDIENANAQVHGVPKDRGRFYNTAVAEEVSAVLALRTEREIYLRQLNDYLVTIQPFDARSKQLVDARVENYQKAYSEAVEASVRLVSEAKNKYKELGADEEIKKALIDLGKTAKVKPRLGPSRRFETFAKWLDNLGKRMRGSHKRR